MSGANQSTLPRDGEPTVDLLERDVPAFASPESFLVHGEEGEEHVPVPLGIVRCGHKQPENDCPHHDERLPPPPLSQRGERLAILGAALLVALLRQSRDRKLGLDEARSIGQGQFGRVCSRGLVRRCVHGRSSVERLDIGGSGIAHRHRHSDAESTSASRFASTGGIGLAPGTGGAMTRPDLFSPLLRRSQPEDIGRHLVAHTAHGILGEGEPHRLAPTLATAVQRMPRRRIGHGEQPPSLLRGKGPASS